MLCYVVSFTQIGSKKGCAVLYSVKFTSDGPFLLLTVLLFTFKAMDMMSSIFSEQDMDILVSC